MASRHRADAGSSTARRFAPLVAGLAICLAAETGRAEYPSWQELADVSVIEVLTHDADGGLRETKVWFVLLDGEPYLRTGGTRWLDNLRRDPDLGLRIEGRDYEARAQEVTGDEIVGRVDAAMREKYAWQDRALHLFSRSRPDILKLSPRESAGGL
jgi:hypothetical protein